MGLYFVLLRTIITTFRFSAAGAKGGGVVLTDAGLLEQRGDDHGPRKWRCCLSRFFNVMTVIIY